MTDCLMELHREHHHNSEDTQTVGGGLRRVVIMQSKMSTNIHLSCGLLRVDVKFTQNPSQTPLFVAI